MGQQLIEDRLNLPEGPVTLISPASLSPESAEDLGDWLAIVLRQIQRAVKKDGQPPAAAQAPPEPPSQPLSFGKPPCNKIPDRRY
jgi:hypothetical protein